MSGSPMGIGVVGVEHVQSRVASAHRNLAHFRQSSTEGSASGAGLPAWKRALDILLILAAAPAWLLIGSAVAVIIKAGSPGPILFRQRRVGYRGAHFTCFKFRTMKIDADQESHRKHAQQLMNSNQPMVKLDSRRDPRLVPLASFLRSGGLDELPQILNVLRGEMSLVGPRPCLPYEHDLYEPWQRKRFDAVPGLTGLWQVSGKNRTTFEQMIRLDIEYARRKSLWLDLWIIVRTIPALWGQYCDVRSARKATAAAKPEATVNTVQSFGL